MRMSNQDIFITEYIAREGAEEIVRIEEERIRQRFNPYFCRKLYGQEFFRNPDDRTPEDKAAAIRGVLEESGTPWFRPIGYGGVYKALWDLSEELHCGLDVVTGKFPLRQEWIEICELAEVNPYCMISGCEVILGVTDQGEYLARKLAEQNIHMSYIGCISNTKDRILRQGENIRYLNRPEEDALKVYLSKAL